MNIIVFLFVILSLIDTSTACSCAPPFPDTSKPDFLCCYDYALRGTVVKDVFSGKRTFRNRTYYTNRVYTVKVQEIFKGEEKIRIINGNTSYVEIHTGPDGAQCGTEIPSNKDYFISGRIYNEKKIENVLCSSWNKEWINVKDSFKQFIPKLKTCPCNGVNPTHTQSTPTKLWSSSPTQNRTRIQSTPLALWSSSPTQNRTGTQSTSPALWSSSPTQNRTGFGVNLLPLQNLIVMAVFASVNNM